MCDSRANFRNERAIRGRDHKGGPSWPPPRTLSSQNSPGKLGLSHRMTTGVVSQASEATSCAGAKFFRVKFVCPFCPS